jgi:hypothetical protein
MKTWRWKRCDVLYVNQINLMLSIFLLCGRKGKIVIDLEQPAIKHLSILINTELINDFPSFFLELL